jgi:hypothetical protein
MVIVIASGEARAVKQSRRIMDYELWIMNWLTPATLNLKP